jgi:MFS transporter, OFA family, oxalate/formate antiporter
VRRGPDPGSAGPDDGREPPAVRVVLAGGLANLAVGTLFAWSLVARQAADGVGMPPGAAAAVFSGAIVVFSAVLLGLAPFLRRYGPARLLHVAAALGGGGLLLAAGAPGPLLLGAGVALLFGAANGVGYGVALALAARVPARRRGLATGVVVAAYAAGPLLLGLVAPAALRAHGWRTGLAALAASVAVLLTVAARLAAPVRAPRPGSGTPAGRAPAGSVLLLWLLFAGGAAPGLALFALAVPLAEDRHLGPQAAGLAVSALAAGNLVGRLVAGWGSDRIGRLPALLAAGTTAAVSVAGLVGPTAPPAVLAGFLGTGLAYGGVSALVPAATLDRVGPRAYPSAYGRVFTGWGLAGLLAPAAAEGVLHLAGHRPALVGLIAAPLVPAGVAWLLLAGRPGAGAVGGPPRC